MRIIVALLLIGMISSLSLADTPIPDIGKTYNIPYKLTDTLHVLVRAKINGKGPYNFIVDTGAPVLFVSKGVGKKLGLKADSKNWGKIARFDIEGGAVNKEVRVRVETPFQLESMNAMNFAGAELHGVIGYSILAKYKLEFDLSRHKMRWTRLNFNPPPPRSLGVKGKAGGGLNAMAGVIKMLSLFTGRRKNPALIPRGFVGIALKEVDDKVIVRQVLRKSPAAKAGVKVGDRIMKIGEDNVDRLADVFSAAVHLNPGTTIPMTILRAGNKEELTITPGKGL